MIGWVAISLVMAATVATLVATVPVPGALVVLQLRMSGGQAKAGCCYSANSGLIGWMLLLDMASVTMGYLGDKMEIILSITIEKFDENWSWTCAIQVCFGLLPLSFVLVLSVPCFGSWSLVPWQKEATLKLERAPFTASFQHFVTQKKAKEFWKGKAFWAPFRFLFFGGYVQSPLLASVQGFGDRLRYALLQAKRSAGKPSARGTSGTAPEMQ